MAAYQAGTYSEAIQHFQLAYAARKSPNISFNIAMSFEKLGDQQSAVTWWKRYRAHEPSDGVAIEQRILSLTGKGQLSTGVGEANASGGATLSQYHAVALGVGAVGALTATVLGSVAMYYSNRSNEEPADRAKERYGRQSRGYALTTDVTWVYP